ncbi:MAG: efflux RND transporter periplasmic adaptor subunit [bacterium]
MKKIIIGILILFILIGGGFYLSKSKKNKLPQFRTAQIDRGEIASTVSATGTVKPVKEVQVGSQVSGTIEKIYVDFNDQVKAGQIICELDPRTLKAKVSQDQANLLIAQSRAKKAQFNLEVSKRELERSNKLAQENLLSASELDKEQANNNALKAELDTTEAEIEQTEATLALSRINLSYTIIRSPVDGIVISRNVDVGQTVAASLQAPVLFEIAENMDKINILASVGEADIGQIKAAQSVTFTVDAYPDLKFSGKVLQIRLASTVNQNVVTYTVVVEADNPGRRLLPGMTANMEFEIARTPAETLRVTNIALRFEPDPSLLPKEATDKGLEKGRPNGQKREKNLNNLWIVENGTLKKIKVKTGLSDGTYTQITGREVQEGLEAVVGVKEKGEDETSQRIKNPFIGRMRGRKK